MTIPYGERVLYARGGNVRSTAGPVRLSGPQWYLPPQPGARPVTVFLNREARAAPDWEVRVLPLAPAAPGETALRPTGGVLRAVGVRLAGDTTAAPLGLLAPGRYLVTAARADAPASVLAADVLEVTDLALTALTTPTGLWVWTTRLDDGRGLPGVRLRAVASLFGPEGERVSSRPLPPVTTDARGLAFLPQRDGERLAVYGDVALGGVSHRAALGTGDFGLWSGDETRARTFIQTDKPVYRPGETLRGLAVARRLGPGTRSPYRGPVTVRLVDDGYPALTLARRSANADADSLVAASLSPLAPDLARPLYTRARRGVQTTTTGTLVLRDAGGWRGDTEPTALLLEAGAALGQTADVLPLTRALLDRKTGAAWPGPLATGAALRALRRVVEGETAGQPGEVTLRVGSWEKTVRLGVPVRVVVLPEAVKAGEPLTLQADGPFAFRRELHVRAKDATPAAPSLVHVERRYDRTRVERDGVVTVTLTVRADVGARHLRVTDPLPGGLEAVDDRPFASPGTVNPPRSGTVTWAERSIYDDRAVFYLERVEPGVTTIRYGLRALAPGRYTAPAPRVDLAGGGVPAVGSAEAVEVLE